MQEADRQRFTEMLIKLAGIYNRTISASVQDSYWELLCPYKMEDVMKAAREVVETCKFFPTPAHFIDMIDIRPPDYVALPEPEVDPEETRRCLRLAGIAAKAFRCGLKPNTPEWEQFIEDYEKASEKEREILQRQIRMRKIKPGEFKSMPDIIEGVLGDKQ